MDGQTYPGVTPPPPCPARTPSPDILRPCLTRASEKPSSPLKKAEGLKPENFGGGGYVRGSGRLIVGTGSMTNILHFGWRFYSQGD